MKKWMIVIFPGAMLAIFLVAYMAESKRRDAREKAHAAEEARVKKDKDDREAALRAKASDEARKKATDRALAERKKEEERMAKWNKDGQDIEKETGRAQKAADDAAKEIAKMEIELTKFREAREKGNRDYLEAMKRSQAAQIDRRSAEFEIDRLLEMIKRRAGENALKKFVPPPAPVRS